LVLTGSEVKLVSGGTVTTEELNSATGSGLNSEEKPSNLAEPASTRWAKPGVRISAWEHFREAS